MDLGTAINLGLGIFLALLVALTILKGWRKGRKLDWQHALTRLIAASVSLVIAVIVSRAVALSLTDFVYGELLANELPEEVVAAIDDMPSILEAAKACVCILLTPFLFYPLFFFIKIFVGIISRIVLKIVLKIVNEKKNASKEEEIAQSYTDEDGVEQTLENEETSEDEEKTEEVFESEETSENEEASENEEISESEEAAETSCDEAVENSNEEESTETPTEESETELQDELQSCALDDGDNEITVEKPEKKKPFANTDVPALAAVLLSILCSLLVFVAYIAPISGTLKTVSSVIGDVKALLLAGEGVSEEEFAEEMGEAAVVFDVADSVSNNVVLNSLQLFGGQLVYNQLTTATVGNTTVSLTKEIDFAVAGANVFIAFDSMDGTTEPLAAAVENFVDAFNESSVAPTILADFLSSAAQQWSEGEEFLGIEAPELDNAIGTAALDVFKDCSADTIKEDVTTVANILVVICRSDLLTSEDDDIINVICKREFLDPIFTEIINNDRLVTLISAVMDMGLDMVLEGMGTPADSEVLYGDFLVDLAGTVGEEDPVAAVVSVFEYYGVAITEDSAEDIADAIAHVSNQDTEAIKTALRSETVILADGSDQEVLMNQANFTKYTVVMTADKIGVKGEATDKEKDVAALVDLFILIPDFMNNMDNIGENMSPMFTAFGKVLDGMTKISFIGSDCIENLIIAVLQSDILGDFNLSRLTAFDFAEYVNESAHNRSYESVMGDIVGMIDAVSNATSMDTFDAESIKDVLGNLTPTGAEAFKNFVTPEFIESCGVGTESSQAVSDMVYNIFDGLADAKNNGMSDEEYKAETEKVAEIVEVFTSLAEDVSNSSENDGSIFGEGTQNGLSASEYIDKVTESKTVTDAIVNTVYKNGDEPTVDPVNSGFEFNEQEKGEFVDALQAKLDSASAEEMADTEKTVIALGALMNTPVQIVDGVVVPVVVEVVE